MGLNTLSAITAVSGKGKCEIGHSSVSPEDRQLTFRPFVGTAFVGVPVAITVILDSEAWDDLIATIKAELADSTAPPDPLSNVVSNNTSSECPECGAPPSQAHDPICGQPEVIKCDDRVAHLFGSESAARRFYDSAVGDKNLVSPRGGWGRWTVETKEEYEETF